MRNAASSARSTRQQLRPGTNNEDCAAEDREPGRGDCSDCFCNFLATFILRSGEKCKSSALAGVKNVTGTSFRETVCRIDTGWGTRCPMSDILSTFFNCVSGHRPTHNSDALQPVNRSVSCTAFSTVVMFCTWGSR